MIRLLFGLLLIHGAFAINLQEYLQKSPEEITNKDVSELLESIQKSATPDEDLADLKAFLVKNAQSHEERKVIESMSDLLNGIISARNTIGIDSQLYPAESFEELSSLLNPNAKKEASDSGWKLDADLFDQQVKEFIDALNNEGPSKEESNHRLVQLNAEEQEQEAHRLALNYYKTLFPNEEKPSFVTDEIMEIVLKSIKSEEFPDAEAEQSATEFREAVALLEKGYKKVDSTENEDLNDSSSPEYQKNSFDEQVTQQDDKATCQSEVLVETHTGRRYCLVEMNQNELEKDAERITLNYYHSLFPDEDRPSEVTDEINDKLFAALKSIDISNHKKTKAQNEFQEELEIHQKGLRKEYLSDNESERQDQNHRKEEL